MPWRYWIPRIGLLLCLLAVLYFAFVVHPRYVSRVKLGCPPTDGKSTCFGPHAHLPYTPTGGLGILNNIAHRPLLKSLNETTTLQYLHLNRNKATEAITKFDNIMTSRLPCALRDHGSNEIARTLDAILTTLDVCAYSKEYLSKLEQRYADLRPRYQILYTAATEVHNSTALRKWQYKLAYACPESLDFIKGCYYLKLWFRSHEAEERANTMKAGLDALIIEERAIVEMRDRIAGRAYRIQGLLSCLYGQIAPSQGVGCGDAEYLRKWYWDQLAPLTDISWKQFKERFATLDCRHSEQRS